MRHHNVRRKPAVNSHTYDFLLSAQIIVPSLALATFTTAHPGVHDPPVTDRDSFCTGAQFDHVTQDLMSDCTRQFDPPVTDVEPFAPSATVEAFPKVNVGVANAAMGHFDEHLTPFEFGDVSLYFLQRPFMLDNRPSFHFGAYVGSCCENETSEGGRRHQLSSGNACTSLHQKCLRRTASIHTDARTFTLCWEKRVAVFPVRIWFVHVPLTGGLIRLRHCSPADA